MTAIWQNDGTAWRLLSPAGFPDEAALQSLVEQAPRLLPLGGWVIPREALRTLKVGVCLKSRHEEVGSATYNTHRTLSLVGISCSPVKQDYVPTAHILRRCKPTSHCM